MAIDLLSHIKPVCNYSAASRPKVWYFSKHINPSMELLKPSMASKIPETPYLCHSANIKLNSYEISYTGFVGLAIHSTRINGLSKVGQSFVQPTSSINPILHFNIRLLATKIYIHK